VEGERKVYRAGGVLPTVQWTVTQTPHLRPAANAAPKDAAAELARARAA
jgi:hypothetical protein